MKYAAIFINDHKRIVHVNEVEVISKYEPGEIEIQRLKNSTLSLVEGEFARQLNSPEYSLDEYMEDVIGSELAYFHNGYCYIVKLKDVIFPDDVSYSTKFYALIEGHLPNTFLPVAAFKYDNVSALFEHFSDRLGIFSIEKKHNIEIANDMKLTELAMKVLRDPDEDEQTEEDNTDPYVLYTADREEIIEQTKNKESLFGDHRYTYHLKNTYNPEDTTAVFHSYIHPYTMNLLIAYIQYSAADIDETYGLSETEIIHIIKNLYEKKSESNVIELQNIVTLPCTIDLYINWEFWCGEADEIENISLFHHDQLDEYLREIIAK